jgi:hypothetical protein
MGAPADADEFQTVQTASHVDAVRPKHDSIAFLAAPHVLPKPRPIASSVPRSPIAVSWSTLAERPSVSPAGSRVVG